MLRFTPHQQVAGVIRSHFSDGVASSSRRGITVGYESVSGDAMALACETGANPVYRIWDGASWSATSTVVVSSSQPCNFL